MHLQTGNISVVFPAHLGTAFISQVRKRRLREVETCLLEQGLNSPGFRPYHYSTRSHRFCWHTPFVLFFLLSFPILSSKRTLKTVHKIWPCHPLLHQNLSVHSEKKLIENTNQRRFLVLTVWMLGISVLLYASAIWGKTKINVNGWTKTSTNFS